MSKPPEPREAQVQSIVQGFDRQRSASASATCWCVDGWLCQRHPHKPWPHEECEGPGERCLRTDCASGRTNLRAAIARWRIESAAANAGARAKLDRLIVQSEMRLAIWERAHRHD